MVSSFKSLSLALTLAVALFHGPAAAGERGPTVVELFTSQGCSSCPPADAFLGELAGRGDVLALSFHVDYWDYIGWKDPYASPVHTQRQRDYVRAFGQRYVYTPQMVIDGAFQASGSDRDAVLGKIAKRDGEDRVDVGIRRSGAGEITVTLPDSSPVLEAVVWVAAFDKEHVTAVTRGENKGTTMRNYNVVRKLMRVATWDGQALNIPVTLPKMEAGSGCAVIVQSATTGRIIGAAVIDLKS